MTTTSPLEIALAYHRAWTSGSLDEAMNHVAADVVCHGPAGTMTGVETLRGFMAPFAHMMTGSELWAAHGDDGGAVLVYDTSTPVVDSAPAAECYVTADGKITTIRIIFDRLPFALASGEVVLNPSAPRHTA